MGLIDHRFASNAYLKLAQEAIVYRREPLTPTEMLETARQEGFLPDHLYGATMHKTLSARLAENIRRESQQSVFYRTAPARFFLHSLASQTDTPRAYKEVYVGNLRTKTIRKENVLVAPRNILSDSIFGEYVPFDESQFENLYRNHCTFLDRTTAENDPTVKQFVTFTLVYHNSNILIYRRGQFTTTSDLLKGQLSVGFGGHVNDKDFDLFNSGSGAFRSNAARELKEELFLDDVYREQYDAAKRTKILGYVNVDDSADAEHHIAVLVAFQHIDESIPKKGELSINQLSWLNLNNIKNDTSSFDLWSEIILKGLYSGKINLPAMESNFGG
jgi:predicted NUDIX family phosphoesterase